MSRVRATAAMGASAGFTLWELLVVVALVVFLVIAAIENLLPLRGEAEEAATTATVGRLRSALGLESVRRVIADGTDALSGMHGANPMNWLAVKPVNYAGVTDEGSLHSVQRGHWGYVQDAGVLFYRVRYPEYFEGSFTEPPGLRFRVTVERNAKGTLSGVRLEQLDAGEWTTQHGSELGRWLEGGQ